MKRLALLALLGCLWASQASAAITYGELGKATAGTGSATLQLTTTTNACPVNSLAIVVLAVNSSSAGQAPLSVTDDAAVPNTYTAGVSFSAAGTQRFQPFYSVITSNLPIGNHITGTWNGSTQTKYLIATCVTGLQTVNVRDKEGAGFSGSWSGSTLEFTTATTTSTIEALFAIQFIALGSSDMYTEDTSWTADNSASAATSIVRLAHQTTAATGTFPYQPTLSGTVRATGANYITFRSTPAVGGTCTYQLMGVGTC
jgi:hypothetical protein